jgi:hypothetical protein
MSGCLSKEHDARVARQVPDKPTELAGYRNADLRDLHLAAEVELAKALSEAQLCFPGDVSDELGLALLAHLLLATMAIRLPVAVTFSVLVSYQ